MHKKIILLLLTLFICVGVVACTDEFDELDEYEDNNYDETYDYFMKLSLDEQHAYIRDNFYLSEYSYELLYNTKESTARQVARRASYMGRVFNNRFSRY